MTTGIGSYSAIYSTQALSHAARAAASVTAVDNDFSVPESSVRAQQTAEAQQAQTAEARDYIADSVELSSVHPQLVNQSYAPTPAQQAQQVAVLADQATERSFLDNRDDEATGAATTLAVEESHALPDEDEESEGADETDESGAGSRGANETGADGQNLTEEEMAQVRQLANRDREVRAHEQAHKSVGGQYSGAMSFEYQQGPDGNRYAVGGEVSIDTSTEREPEATIRKMQQVKAAALAPAEPSAQDLSVAATATAAESQARQELSRQQMEPTASADDGTAESGEAAESSGQAAASGGTETLASSTDFSTSSSADSSATSASPYGDQYRTGGVSFSSAYGVGLENSMMRSVHHAIDIVA